MVQQSKLKQLLNYRDRTVQEVTDQILSQLEHVTSAVQTFFEFDQEQGYVVNWDDISFTDEAKQDQNGLLILVGTIYHQNQPVNVIKIGIPFDLAVDSCENDIIEFLRQNTDTNADVDHDEFDLETDEQLEQLEQEQVLDPNDQDQQSDITHVDQISTADNICFDLEQLTPEQKQRLEWFTLTSDHTTNSKLN